MSSVYRWRHVTEGLQEDPFDPELDPELLEYEDWVDWKAVEGLYTANGRIMDGNFPDLMEGRYCNNVEVQQRWANWWACVKHHAG